MKQITNIFLALVASIWLIAPVAYAERDVNVPPSDDGNTNSGGRVNAECLLPNSSAFLDINNVRARVMNRGDMWWNTNSTASSAQYEVPKVTDPTQISRHSLFAGGIWIAGTETAAGSAPRVLAQTFRQGQQTYWSGPLRPIGPSGTITEGRMPSLR